jgi:arylsulfatase A-like enzyme
MARPPNILLITSDQQRWNTIGALNPEIRTPHLDRLAQEGTLFTHAYCPNPTCTPTRASIITGLYPSQHGAYSLGTKLSERVPTVGDEFARAGYRTALIGKAHFHPLRGTTEHPSVSLMDKYIGRILDNVDELGIADTTLVLFTSDHGHLYGQHGMAAKGAFHYEDLECISITLNTAR